MYAKEILEPLGMEDTAFWIPQEKQHRLTNVYESIRTQDGQRKLVRYTGSHLGIRNDMSREPAFASGGAGLVCWILHLRNGEAGACLYAELFPSSMPYELQNELPSRRQKIISATRRKLVAVLCCQHILFVFFQRS